MRGTPVAVGTTITLPEAAGRRSYRVKESCTNDGGQWACVTHGEFFRNNLQAELHESDADKAKPVAHDVVWFCYYHGPETVPAGQPVKAGVTG